MYTVSYSVDRDDDNKIFIDLLCTIDYDYIMSHGTNACYDLIFDNLKSAIAEASGMAERDRYRDEYES